VPLNGTSVGRVVVLVAVAAVRHGVSLPGAGQRPRSPVPVHVHRAPAPACPTTCPEATSERALTCAVKGFGSADYFATTPLERPDDSRPEVPQAFPVGGHVLVLDFSQECVGLDSFGGQKPRARLRRRRVPGGARASAEAASRGAHDESLPRLQWTLRTELQEVSVGGRENRVLAGRLPKASPTL
jgi:hypothetical protein